MFETFEGRRLSSITLSNGILSIVGTAGRDDIEVFSVLAKQSGSKLTYNLQVHLDDQDQTFAFADVQRITIQSLGGKDEIIVSDRYVTKANTGSNTSADVAIPISISEGAGNDLIRAHSDTLINGIADPTGGIAAAKETIIGGEGNDSIIAGDGDDLISAGNGDDTVEGMDGADTIFGQGGNDILRGAGGADSIYGGEGSDTISGGKGKDIVIGGNGDDTLYGAEGGELAGNQRQYRDTLDGGAGFDAADTSNVDLHRRVETIIVF
jgi:Ca2+-binding RTX toxin-like protein